MKLNSVFDAQPLKCVRENSVVPPGLRSRTPLFPALKRRAIARRPSGARTIAILSHRVMQNLVLTHTLKRCATQKQEQNRVFQQTCKARADFTRVARPLRQAQGRL